MAAAHDTPRLRLPRVGDRRSGRSCNAGVRRSLAGHRGVATPRRTLVGADRTEPSVPGDDRVGSFGGAQVVEATPDLRQALGVRSGLLVVVVDPDTP